LERGGWREMDGEWWKERVGWRVDEERSMKRVGWRVLEII
jgi:hypothetical protein